MTCTSQTWRLFGPNSSQWSHNGSLREALPAHTTETTLPCIMWLNTDSQQGTGPLGTLLRLYGECQKRRISQKTKQKIEPWLQNLVSSSDLKHVRMITKTYHKLIMKISASNRPFETNLLRPLEDLHTVQLGQHPGCSMATFLKSLFDLL